MGRDKLTDLRKDYHKSELNRELLHDDPMKQFSSWFQMALTAEDGIEANAMVLSTVDADQQPSGRVVLLKEITDEGFVFFTNYQSKKGIELSGNQKCALTFWWRVLEKQIRIQGTVVKIAARDSSRYFASRPLDSQLGAAISPQSQAIPNRQFLEDKLAQLKSELTDGAFPPRPENWGGYVVKPNAFEFWQGRANRLHDRFKYVWVGDSWEIHRLAP